MPVYEIEKSCGKGPQLFSRHGNLVAPDMLVFTSNGQLFIEAKHKSVFAWNRTRKQWVTGIDLHHYNDYLHVARRTKLPVWLMFLHKESQPDPRDIQHGCPPLCPTGLFGGEIFELATKENHRSIEFDPSRAGFKGHGRTGMVYWAHRDLRMLATLDDVTEAAFCARRPSVKREERIVSCPT
jgi:hypothetical protein